MAGILLLFWPTMGQPIALQPAICYRPGVVDKADTTYAVSPDRADDPRGQLDYCREF